MTTVSTSAQDTSPNNVITTSAIDMTGMKLIVIWTSCFTGVNSAQHDAATPITDSSGNTYSRLAGPKNTGGNGQAYGGFFYCLNPTVTSSMTFSYHTTTGATDFPSISVIGWDNPAISSVVDIGDTAHIANATGVTSLATPNAVTTNANDLIVVGFGDANGGSVTLASSGSTSTTFTKDQDQPSAAGEPVALGHAIVSATGTYAATWSGFSSGDCIAGIAAFKAGSGGGSGVKDTPSRFRLVSATVFRDTLARFKLVSPTTYRHTPTRLLLRAQAFKDTSARFILRSSNQAFRDTLTRLKLQPGNAFRDSRVRLLVQSLAQWRDTPTRLKIAGLIYHDTVARFSLLAPNQSFRDTPARFKQVSAATYRHTALRFKLASASAYRDSAARFRLAIQALRDTRTRFGLSLPGIRDTRARFVIQVPGAAWRNTATRFAQRSAVLFRDTASRLVVLVPAYRFTHARYRLVSQSIFRDTQTRLIVLVPPPPSRPIINEDPPILPGSAVAGV